MNTNQAKEKIRKLLALAQDKSNENEAEAALLAARKLMAQHKLTENDLDEGKRHELRQVVYEDQTFSGLKNAWMIDLAKVMAEYHCCYACMRGTKGQTTRKVVFAGLDDDPEIVLVMFEYAVQHIQKMVAEYRKRVLWNITDKREKNNAARSFEQSYAQGFQEGIKAKYEQQNREAANDEQEGEQVSTALVMVQPKEVTDWAKRLHTVNFRVRGAEANESAKAQGFSAGLHFNPTKQVKA